MTNKQEYKLTDFPIQSYDKIRYCDTDRQGHVNNAVFSSFLETGRVDLLLLSGMLKQDPTSSFVIAGLELNYLKEIHFPGLVNCGTGILKIGNSSIKVYQRLYQHEICVAEATTTLVQVNASGKSLGLGIAEKEFLAQYFLTQIEQ